jgi:hypothetical protein
VTEAADRFPGIDAHFASTIATAQEVVYLGSTFASRLKIGCYAIILLFDTSASAVQTGTVYPAVNVLLPLVPKLWRPALKSCLLQGVTCD